MPTVAKKVLRSEILKHYEEKLPENYRAVKIVDTKNQFTVKVFGFLRFVLFAVVFALVLFAFGTDFRQMSEEFYALSDVRKFLTIFLFMACFALCMLLHEFLHALVYKIFTKHGGRSEVSFQRGADNNAHLKNMVKIVFSFSYSYRGVPDIFVYRTASLCALLAPFVIFGIAFVVPMFFLQNTVWFVFLAAIFSLHFGLCINDLYIVLLYIFKFRNGKTLMRKTDSTLTFFLPYENATEQNDTSAREN